MAAPPAPSRRLPFLLGLLLLFSFPSPSNAYRESARTHRHVRRRSGNDATSGGGGARQQQVEPRVDMLAAAADPLFIDEGEGRAATRGGAGGRKEGKKKDAVSSAAGAKAKAAAASTTSAAATAATAAKTTKAATAAKAHASASTHAASHAASSASAAAAQAQHRRAGEHTTIAAATAAVAEGREKTLSKEKLAEIAATNKRLGLVREKHKKVMSQAEHVKYLQQQRLKDIEQIKKNFADARPPDAPQPKMPHAFGDTMRFTEHGAGAGQGAGQGAGCGCGGVLEWWESGDFLTHPLRLSARLSPWYWVRMMPATIETRSIITSGGGFALPLLVRGGRGRGGQGGGGLTGTARSPRPDTAADTVFSIGIAPGHCACAGAASARAMEWRRCLLV